MVIDLRALVLNLVTLVVMDLMDGKIDKLDQAINLTQQILNLLTQERDRRSAKNG